MVIFSSQKVIMEKDYKTSVNQAVSLRMKTTLISKKKLKLKGKRTNWKRKNFKLILMIFESSLFIIVIIFIINQLFIVKILKKCVGILPSAMSLNLRNSKSIILFLCLSLHTAKLIYFCLFQSLRGIIVEWVWNQVKNEQF